MLPLTLTVPATAVPCVKQPAEARRVQRSVGHRLREGCRDRRICCHTGRGVDGEVETPGGAVLEAVQW